jgi:EmrB/QacA subfamily drug resistance transporter
VTAQRSRMIWTLAITSVALFMGALDNLVVTTALPVMRVALHASLSELEWTVNAYTLAFAVFLLTGSSLGDRFGRRRMLMAGVAVFTLGSAAAALSPDSSALIAARMVQGVGAAVMTPLTLTVLSAAVPAERRGMALGVWGAVGGLAIALGPVVGGVVVQGLSWKWIFWLNVPIGLALLPLVRVRINESKGVARSLDVPGLFLGSAGLLGIVFGLVRANALGWTSTMVLASIAGGAAILAGFVAWELRTPEPMLPMGLFRSRGFSAANAASFFLYFGMFGSVFLLAQFLQTAQHYTPLQAGLRILPWTAMPMVVAPVAGALSDRFGGRVVVLAGLVLQSSGLLWLALLLSRTQPYGTLVPAFVVSGVGMGLFFAPVANTVLSSVRPHQEGIASGATNAIRELGGVFGIAVLSAVFSANGGYASPAAFVSGARPAVAVGALVVMAGALAMAFVPRRAVSRRAAVPAAEAAEEALPRGVLAG